METGLLSGFVSIISAIKSHHFLQIAVSADLSHFSSLSISIYPKSVLVSLCRRMRPQTATMLLLWQRNEERKMTAKRELFEESGISDAEIYPVCDYLGYDSKGSATGVIFLAVVHSLGTMPESEMQEIGFFDEIPSELTYPNVSPVLFREANKLLRAK